MSIVRIDPEGRRNAEHIAIIIVVGLVPIQSHFRSSRPQAQQPLYQDGHTATGPAHLLTKNLFVAVVVVFSAFWLL